MQHLDITDSNVTLLALIKTLRTLGEDILLEEMGEPVAKISKYEEPVKKKKFGAFKGRVPIIEKLPEWDEEMQGYLGMKTSEE